MRLHFFYWLSILYVITALPGQGQSKPEINKPAPLISADVWLNNPAYKFRNPEGKVIVLDFWFTSCAPCMYTIPHLNDLSEHYKNNNVVFAAITFEKKKVVEKFLLKKEIRANIGIDTTERIIHSFGVQGFPQTFLIDEKGILRWSGYPGHLTTDIIDEVLGKTSQPIKTANISISQSQELTKKVYPITVTKNTYMNKASSGFQSTPEEFSLVNAPIDRILAIMLQTSISRISTMDTNKYDVRFVKPKDLPYEKLSETMAESFLRELKYKASYTDKKVTGYELLLTNDSLFIKNAIDTAVTYFYTSASSDSKSWTGTGVTISDLIRELENRFSIIIVDKTNLNVYLKISVPVKSFDQAKAGLLTYGLELKPKEFVTKVLEIVPHKK